MNKNKKRKKKKGFESYSPWEKGGYAYPSWYIRLNSEGQKNEKTVCLKIWPFGRIYKNSKAENKHKAVSHGDSVTYMCDGTNL